MKKIIIFSILGVSFSALSIEHTNKEQKIIKKIKTLNNDGLSQIYKKNKDKIKVKIGEKVYDANIPMYLLLNDTQKFKALMENNNISNYGSFSNDGKDYSDLVIIAIDLRDFDLFKKLYDKLSDSDKRTTFLVDGVGGYTYLMEAAKAGDTKIIKEILDQGVINPYFKNFNGENAYDIAKNIGDPEVIKILKPYKKEKIKPKKSISFTKEMVKKNREDLLNSNISDENAMLIKRFVKEINKNNMIRFNQDPNSFFYNEPLLPIEIKEEINLYSKALTDPDWANKNAKNIYIYAIINGFNELADYIYDTRLKNNYIKSSRGIGPILATAISNVYGGNTEYIQKILKRGKYDKKEGIDGKEAIFYAAENNSFKVLYHLISNGFDFLANDKNGLTPLDYATAAKAEEAKSILLVAEMEYEKEIYKRKIRLKKDNTINLFSGPQISFDEKIKSIK